MLIGERTPMLLRLCESHLRELMQQAKTLLTREGEQHGS